MAFVIKAKPKFESNPEDHSPRYLLHRHLRGTRKARSYSKVHASDLMSSKGEFCPREYALGMKYFNPRPDDKILTCEQVTFDYGYAVEDLVRTYFAEMGRAVGEWKCVQCNQLHSFQHRPAACTNCKGKVLEYEEVRVESVASGVSCGIDLLVDFGRPRLTVVEIKSMEATQFKKLLAPLAEHKFRTNLYMRCAQESEHPMKHRIDFQRSYIIYVVKGGYGHQDPEMKLWGLLDGDFSPFKEYPIERDDSLTQTLMERATMVEEFKKTGVLPLGICPTSICNRARFCQQVDHCFDEKNA